MPPVAAEMRHEEGPGLLPADRAYVIAGTNKFAFLIPPGLKLETWSQHLVALVTRDYSCQITFRLAGPLDVTMLRAHLGHERGNGPVERISK